MTDSPHKEDMKKLQKEQREKVKSKLIDRGILIVNTGDGKGKSTAAFGTAMRAVGHGYKVAVVQFIKGNWSTGEQKIFEKFDEITHVVSGDGFTWDTQDKSKDIESAESGWQKVEALIEECRGDNPKYHLIVLDELNIALSYGYLDVKKVVDVLRDKPENLNIMVTGRGAPEELISIADTVTEMKPIKHAFDNGIQAQRGIEY
ncbi:cob(I)yrinic acid a,c-diamide adenosyltransferase [Lentisphaera profundi]|uniref:corrinoid adenosyltransferase n=1 Tax=Lentisphaera profundi TaxID=1658616 RepID=A0ABY7VUM5_9BACT|nr:cob(I)yrinic acid a,c-diamide adenosyltransferase [Lentisphaera profundi]WDE97905.1 cob(I)yrinic acid a,c-diamide adenosyltransferase [Lentisphaera profundi]